MDMSNEWPTRGGWVDLPRGLCIRDGNEVLEAVSGRTFNLALLANGDGVEVIRGHFEEGKVFGLAGQPERKALFECFYILSGRVRVGGDDGTKLGPGGCISANGVHDVVLCKALTPVTLLHFTSRPMFHEISQWLSELLAIVVEVEEKDGYTAGHCERIRDLSLATAKMLGLPENRLHFLLYGAFLHDVGKVKIPTTLLGKSGKLTADEWVVMRQLPQLGAEIVEPTFMREAAPIIAQHHERLDGSGYPNGLAGDAIQLEAQIVAVADMFDAMTIDRPYRKALPAEAAIQELKRFTEVHYRGDVVDAFLQVVAHEKNKQWLNAGA